MDIFLKIIDFGRSIFTYKNRVFHNDSFSKYGDAEGQYDYPDPNIKGFKRNRYSNKINPNPSFDMCRLSITILDCLRDKEGDVVDFLNYMSTDCHGRNLHKESDESFELYVDIARDSCNAIPRELLLNDIFKKYRIKKRCFLKQGIGWIKKVVVHHLYLHHLLQEQFLEHLIFLLHHQHFL